MGLNRSKARAALALGALAAISAPAALGAAARLPGLERLEPGLWELRHLGNEAEKLAPVCLGDPAILLQLQHRASACSVVNVGQNGQGVTVHYTCPSEGYGHTLLRLETPRLVQIDTQGIQNGRPFQYRAQARRVGACSARAR